MYLDISGHVISMLYKKKQFNQILYIEVPINPIDII